MNTVLLTGALVLGILGLMLMGAGASSLKQKHPVSFMLRTLWGLLALAVGALATTIALGMQGYRALTQEALAAQILVEPAGPQRFNATVRLPDGRNLTFELAGDEVYVDARILKWHP